MRIGSSCTEIVKHEKTDAIGHLEDSAIINQPVFWRYESTNLAPMHRTMQDAHRESPGAVGAHEQSYMCSGIRHPWREGPNAAYLYARWKTVQKFARLKVKRFQDGMLGKLTSDRLFIWQASVDG